MTETALCRIANPSQATRIIFGGPKNSERIAIPAGEKIEATLTRDLIAKLQKAEKAAHPDALRVDEIAPARAAPAPAPAKASAPSPAPAAK